LTELEPVALNEIKIRRDVLAVKKLKIGVLGATRGMEYVKNVLRSSPYAEIYAICDNYAPILDKVKNDADALGFKVHCFLEYDDFLQCGLDGVIIANYANEHAEFAIKALNFGINVLSECLPAQTPAEAARLCDAVEQSGKIYAYSENYCYFSDVFELKRIYERGDIGEAMHIEGNFINDCSGKWHLLTRGNREHWRNFVPSTFYCTHSIGPMLYITGLRATKVVGMELPCMPYMRDEGARNGSAAMEIMQLKNGGMAKSINGNFKRPFTYEYRIIGTDGTIEVSSEKSGYVKKFLQTQKGCYDSLEYHADFYKYSGLLHEKTESFDVIGGSNYYTVAYFIGAILDDAEARRLSIDVYQALDMSLPGIFAYRSILANSNSVDVPDFRNKSERDSFRCDNKSTDPKISGNTDLLPPNKSGFPDIPDEVYARVQHKFFDTPITTGMH